MRFCSAFLLLIYVSASSSASDHTIKIDELDIVSHSVVLSASLVSPREVRPYAALVFVHGSGRQERNLGLAKRLAAEGIATLVYDKRGVGRSQGEYESKQSVSEKNIRLLAEDAAAALAALKSHPDTHHLPLGLTGISQAGWIVPLAAEIGPVPDFMVLWSGPVCKVSEEDIYSKFTQDKDRASVPTYEEALKAREQEYIWPDFLGKDSNPVDSLVKLKIPGLWLFGEEDGSIPVDLSIKNLEELIRSSYPFSYKKLQGVGHNNIDDSLNLVVDWIKTSIDD